MTFIDKIGDLLSELAAAIPEKFYNELHNGIILSEETKHHPVDPDGNLYILGQYIVNSIGRSIVIYSGSVEIVYGHLPTHLLKEELEKILRHELTHHMESLAGERDLEIEDAVNINKYITKATASRKNSNSNEF